VPLTILISCEFAFLSENALIAMTSVCRSILAYAFNESECKALKFNCTDQAMSSVKQVFQKVIHCQMIDQDGQCICAIIPFANA